MLTRLKKIAVLLVIFMVLTLILVPTAVDKTKSTIRVQPPYKVSEPGLALFDSLDFVADLHADSLLWQRNLLKKHDYGHVDIPRLIETNVALQAFTLVSKTPAGMNYKSNSADSDQITALFILQARALKSWFDLTQRVLVQAEQLYVFANQSEGRFRVIKNQQELRQYLHDRLQNPAITAGFLGIEGAQALQGQLENIETLDHAGIRMVGLAHFFDNEVGGSAHGEVKGGLTPFGHKVVRDLEQRQMIIDLSHASTQLLDDVLNIATRPLIISHSGVKGTCNNQRNLSDAQLMKIAAGGGLVGIAMFEQAVCGIDAAATARAITYTANLIGIEHVALGSDFDGGVLTPFDVTGLPLIVDALLAAGMSEADIIKVMGENAKDFLLMNLPAS